MLVTLRYYYFDVSRIADEAKYAKMCSDIRDSLGLRKPVHFESRKQFNHKLVTSTHTLEGKDDTGTVLYVDGQEMYVWAEWFTMNRNIRKGYFLESEE